MKKRKQDGIFKSAGFCIAIFFQYYGKCNAIE